MRLGEEEEGEGEEGSGDEERGEKGEELEEVRGEEDQVGEVERVGANEGAEENQVRDNKTRKIAQLRHFWKSGNTKMGDGEEMGMKRKKNMESC